MDRRFGIALAILAATATAAWLGFFTHRAAPVATITLSQAPDGLRADIALPRPTKEYRFAARVHSRGNLMRLVTPGLRMDDDALRSAKPFDRFALVLPYGARKKTCTGESNKVCTVFMPDPSQPVALGPGTVTPDLFVAPDEGAYRPKLQFNLPAGWIASPAQADPQRTLFIGPADFVTTGSDMTLIAATDTPRDLRRQVSAETAAALRDLTKAFGHGLAHPPRVMLTTEVSEGVMDFELRASANGSESMTVTARGAVLNRGDPAAGPLIREAIRHEAFHLRTTPAIDLARLAKKSPIEAMALAAQINSAIWLWEGGAEYYALTDVAALSPTPDRTMAERLERALNDCFTLWREAPGKTLPEAVQVNRKIAYRCGAVVMWGATLEVAARRPGADFMTIWREMPRVTTASPGRPLAAFNRAVTGDAQKAPVVAGVFLSDRSADRELHVRAALERLGAAFGPDGGDDALSQQILSGLFASNGVCPSGITVTIAKPGGIWIGAASSCSALPSPRRIMRIGPSAKDYLTRADAAAINRLCEDGKTVPVVLDNGAALEPRCRAPLAVPATPAQPRIAVLRWRGPRPA